MPLYLPLEDNPQCHLCEKSDKTLYCAGCGEIAYCSKECQKLDWKRHKAACGVTEKIDLESFCPFIAILADYGHSIAQRPEFSSLHHPALTHRIINDVNPGVPFSKFADGWEATLVKLGDKLGRMDPVLYTKDWWPKAKDMHELNKLRARILREGNVVPILFGLCVALVDSLYTTTYDKEHGTERVRFHFRGLPIVDFGICAGSVRVVAQDKLAYLHPDGSCTRGQDPNDHYWIYFRTARGELLLDLSMFTFNLDMEVRNDPYIPEREILELIPKSAMWMESRGLDSPNSTKPSLLSGREHRRVSVLRNPAVKEAFRKFESFEGKPLYLMGLFPLMDEIAGRSCTMTEQEFLISHTAWCSNRLYHVVVRTKEWKSYPKDVVGTYGLNEEGKDPVVEGKKKWKAMKKKERKERLNRTHTGDADAVTSTTPDELEEDVHS